MNLLNKRLVSLLLALVMVFGMVPGVTIDAFAADVTTEVTMEQITLGDFAIAEVGQKALVSSEVLLSQKSLIAVPHCGAELNIHVNDGYQVRIHCGDNYNNIDQVSGWLSNEESYTLPTSSIYMRVSVQRTDGGAITLEELELAGVVVSYESNSNIVSDNAEIADLLKETDLPVLIHLSDIHGDTIRAERAAYFADYIGADALLASGDLTAYEPDDWGSALFDAMGNYPDVNFIYGIGNHDAKVSASSYQEKIYQSYYAENPLTPDGETYYYQDLANQKLRIISVNQQEGASTTTSGGTCYSQEQVDWLVETLQTTPASYGVVLMYHSPETAIANAMDSDYTEFFQTDSRYDNSTNNYSGYTGTFLMDLVDAFMLRENFCWSYSEKNGASPVELNADFTGVADGVEFIAHVTGHVHSDSVTYLPGTACKQLLLGVTCTNSMYGEPGGYYGLADYSDLNRVGNTASQDAFNAYVIDRKNKTVRILRVGAQETVSGAIRDDMTIPYSVPFAEGEYLFDTEGMIKLDLDDVEWVNYGIQADGTDSTYMSGVRWSPNLVFDVPYEGVTLYIKINAPYEMGIRSGETDTTMTTNYYWLNNKELTTGDKNRGCVYTLPEGHTKFALSLANVDRDGDNNVISTTNTNLINSLELDAAGLEIWYLPEDAAQSAYPFSTEDKTQLDLSDVEWVNYGYKEYGAEPTYLSGVRLTTDVVLDVPYEGVTLYIKINAPYELGIRSGETDTTMTTNCGWLNNKNLSSGDSNYGYMYTIPEGHEKFVLTVGNVTRDSANNVTTSKNTITLEELEAAGLEIWYVPNHTHTYTLAVTYPTCTEQGYTTYTCDCGDSYVDDYVEAYGLHDVDTDKLYNVITVRPGQLDSDTDGTILDSDIYGFVVNYPLKKGHVLSISNTDYVFSVRKLENGSYSTLLRSATSDSYTATEDMTVAMLIRKADKSAVTADELASIVVYDSQYGMIGVPGSVKRFTVEAETIDGGTATTRAAIFLPESYSENGDPTRLIIMTNGLHGHLTDSVWNANTADDVGVMKHYMENGYTVIIVNNTANKTSSTPDLGNPQLISSYWKAYEYAQTYFNVEEMFSIHSRSQGTFAAMRLMREHPELVKCAVMCGAVLSIQSRFSQAPAFIAGRYGFDDTTGATWEADKVVGYDPYTDVNGLEYDLPPTFWVLAEADATTAHLSVIDKIKEHGNDVIQAIYTDTDHSGVCRLNTDACKADSLAFLEKYQDAEPEHRFCAWETVKEAGCTEAGEMRRYCADCEHYESMEIPALSGHVFEHSDTVCDSCGVQFDITRTEITLTPGHFNNTTGAWVESDVYGYVIGYELKAGHTMSISNTDYVFAVRELENGSYATMVKDATSDAFTAEEDMVIAVRVRKPDKSALTEEELAAIVLIDTYRVPHAHTYENGICTGCGVADWDTDGDGILEILAIGNSFSVDALQYAWQIANDLGIEEIVIGNLYIGGCTLETHATNAAGDLAKYTYYYNDSGTWTTTKSYQLSTALESRSWDYVSLQQGSSVSGVESTYNEDLTNLIAYVQARSNAKLVWHMTWAYQQDSTHSAFPTYNSDQMTMYNAIVSAVQNKIVTNDAFDLIVPNGTAVQNSRTSLLGDTTTRDGYHMTKDYGRYLTGLLFVKTVTGLSVDNVTYKPSGVDAEEQKIAIESVNNAAANPFGVTQSIYIGEVPEEGYIQLETELYQGAYWYPMKDGQYNELITDASKSKKYFTTIRFTRETLPVGSILVLADGYQYRPDGWVTDELQTGTREDVTTQSYVVVTEEWWGDYTIRSFNVSLVSGGSVMSLTEEEMRAAFRIYVPEELHTHTYEDGLCTGCGHIAASGIWQIIENGEVISAFSALSDAVNACRTGGTICLTADCSVTSGVVLSKTLTIDGGGYLVDISSCSEALITVNEGVSITLRNLRLDGGATGFAVDYDGVTYTNYTIPLVSGSLANDPKASQSAIISSGTLICENVDISNRYTASVGGAMQILAGSASLADCDFTHNYGTSKGGALFIGSNLGSRTAYPVEQVTISGCTFTGNYSGHGGAIYAYNVSEIDITDSEFVSNTANGGKGGAIDLFSETTKPTNAMALGLDFIQTTIRNCSFRGNWAGNDGFAIQSYDSDLYIYDSEFIENVGVHPTSSVGTVSIEAYRHADESYRIYTLMDGCLFNGNRGPCAVYGDHSSISDLDVTGCVFKNNVGNMSFLLYAATSHISDCQFIGETMALGVIDARIYENYTVAPELTLMDVTFTDCDAPTELLLRKHNHNTALNTYHVILEGATNGDITVWDSNCVTINGTHTGNVQFGYGSERENLAIGTNGKVNGIMFVQPESVQVALGEKFSVTVEAEGEGLTYQWYYKHKNSESFTKSSFKSSAYSMTMATYCHNREIYCVITDANGNSVTTDTVTITAPLTVTKQPTDVQAEIGKRFSISVSALGDGLTYQWYYSSNGGKSFAASSFKGKSYSMTMQSYCHNRQVYCVITDVYGNTVTTDVVTITRPPVELVILSQPADVQVEIGQLAQIAVEVQGEGLTYQWYYKNASGKSFTKSGFNGDTYSMVMREFCHNRQVYCVITDKYGNSVTTEIATMSRPPVELKILEQPADVYAAMGEKFSVRFTVQGEGLTYQWYYKDASAKEFKISSFNGSTYTMTMAGFQNGRQVYCVITDQYGNQLTTDIATIHLEN